jgi:hypothetical protein
MAKKKIESKVTKSVQQEEYNNTLAVVSKAQSKIKAHKDAVAAKEAVIAKLAKLGITEADLKAMGL